MEIEKKLNGKGRSALIISDLHIPYQHIDALQFLKACKEKLLDDKSLIINVGDEVDKHDLSMHPSNADLDSAGVELEKTQAYIKGYEDVFPTMYICSSNHGSLIYRRAKKEGIPLDYLKPLAEVYNVKKWTWHDAIILETKAGPIYICHGKTAAYGKLCLTMGMSAIQGHYHGKFSINWYRSPLGDRFDLYTGCLININSLAFEYGKNNLPKPILGCAFIDNEGHPYLVKMDLDKHGRWTGKIK